VSSQLDSNMSVIRKLILFWASEMLDDNSGLWDVTLCWGVGGSNVLQHVTVCH